MYSDDSKNPRLSDSGRRAFLQKSSVATGAVMTGMLNPIEVMAQTPAKTLVIAAPATPQSLDIEFDVSLGSIDSLGAIYDYMLAYDKVPDPKNPAVMREDTSVRKDKPNNLALRGVLAEKWEISKDGRKGTFTLREGVR